MFIKHFPWKPWVFRIWVSLTVSSHSTFIVKEVQYYMWLVNHDFTTFYVWFFWGAFRSFATQMRLKKTEATANLAEMDHTDREVYLESFPNRWNSWKPENTRKNIIYTSWKHPSASSRSYSNVMWYTTRLVIRGDQSCGISSALDKLYRPTSPCEVPAIIGY